MLNIVLEYTHFLKYVFLWVLQTYFCILLMFIKFVELMKWKVCFRNNPLYLKNLKYGAVIHLFPTYSVSKVPGLSL